MTNAHMEARYGRNKRNRADRRLVVILGSTLAVTLVAFIVWAAFGKPATVKGTVATSTYADGIMTVAFAIDNPTGKAATCQVSAINDHQSSVGSKEVSITATQTSVQGLEIVAVEPATGAVVDWCHTR